MNEDDVYRTSTQFRFWTYTTRTLQDLREASNKLACTRVRDAIKRAQAKDNKSTNGSEIDCLTVEEEQKIIGWYCGKGIELCDFSGFPKAVKATAVQFLKRFYLSNSPMTYHPKQMMLSAVYLATKVENHYISVEEFASKVPKTKADDILAPEFLLTQGLRFTFDVRHPFRGLEGGIMELNEIARGGYIPPTSSGLTSESIKTGILSLNAAEGNAAAAAEKPASLEQFSERLTKAYNNAGSILKEGALLTDVYFIYTPSQIWLSALFVADRPLTEFYLHTILSGVSKSESTPSSPGLESQLRSLMKDCAESMTNSSSSLARDEAETAEVRRIDKKLYQCRNPEKLDLRGMNQAAKKGRDADGEEKVIKKRKVERDLASEEGKQLFGGALQK